MELGNFSFNLKLKNEWKCLKFQILICFALLRHIYYNRTKKDRRRFYAVYSK